jgi:glycosyltransferase involved in cell wall biosynthesis
MLFDSKRPKVALVHDWLDSQGGGERVLKCFHDMWPEAPIYTLVYDPDKAPEWCRACDVRTTYIQDWPVLGKHRKLLLQFMPKAWETLDLQEYDLVVSSCASCCKGVLTRPDAVHVCYCHSPIRYVWDLYYDYMRQTDAVRRFAMKRVIPGIREWDYLAAQRVDRFVANSDYVGKRIKKFYRRDSVTVHPATPIHATKVCEPEGYYLVVSRFVRYKRVDLAVEACNRLGRRLVIIGSGGEEEQRLRELAGPTVEFRGRISDEEMAEAYAGADAFLFPGIEDFGLTPVEAMGSGVPVLAYGEGGALETVEDGQTGLLFGEQVAESLVACIERFEREGVAMSRQEIAEHTRERFSEERFKEQMRAVCEEELAKVRGGSRV